MSKYIQVIEAYDEQGTIKNVSPKVRSIIDMLSYYIAKSKIEGKGTGKIIVVFSHEERVEELLDVAIIKSKIDFNFTEINELSEINARENYLTKTFNAILPFFIKKDLNLSKFKQVIELIKNKNFIFEEQWKSKWNPSKKTQATVRWLYTDNIYFYLDIYHKTKHVKETIHVTTTSSGLGLVELCLGSLKWKDDYIVLLYQNNKRDYWEVNIITKEINFVYEPAITGNPHGQYNLALSYLEGKLGLSQNIEKAIYWLDKAAEQDFTKAIKLREKINIDK